MGISYQSNSSSSNDNTERLKETCTSFINNQIVYLEYNQAYYRVDDCTEVIDRISSTHTNGNSNKKREESITVDERTVSTSSHRILLHVHNLILYLFTHSYCIFSLKKTRHFRSLKSQGYSTSDERQPFLFHHVNYPPSLLSVHSSSVYPLLCEEDRWMGIATEQCYFTGMKSDITHVSGYLSISLSIHLCLRLFNITDSLFIYIVSSFRFRFCCPPWFITCGLSLR